MAMAARVTRRTSSWWAVMVEGESPDLFGPYRSEAMAQAAADRWNNRPDADADEMASVVPLLSGPVR